MSEDRFPTVGDGLANWRKYLSGQPLTEELAAIRDGRTEPEDRGKLKSANQILAETKVDIEQELTRADRALLKELRTHPGFHILIRLQKRAEEIHQRGAISISEQAPLENREAIAQTWAYLGMLKRANRELLGQVNAEIEILDGDGAAK